MSFFKLEEYQLVFRADTRAGLYVKYQFVFSPKVHIDLYVK
jgi:hypothetical protein